MFESKPPLLLPQRAIRGDDALQIDDTSYYYCCYYCDYYYYTKFHLLNFYMTHCCQESFAMYV